MVIEFEMWSPFHYLMMIFPFVLAIFLYYLLRDKSMQAKKNTGLILSIISILILVTRNIYICIVHGALNPEVFPFQVCHFASFVFLLAVLSKSNVWGTIAWCLNFPAGLVSVIFADGLERYPTMVNIQAMAYIAGHMLIVTIGLYFLLAGIIKINWQALKKAYLYVGIGYIASVLINSWFNILFAHTGKDSNYFYSFKPEAGTPLEDMFVLGSNYTVWNITFNPVYLLLLGIVGAVVLTAMYGIYYLTVHSKLIKHG